MHGNTEDDRVVTGLHQTSEIETSRLSHQTLYPTAYTLPRSRGVPDVYLSFGVLRGLARKQGYPLKKEKKGRLEPYTPKPLLTPPFQPPLLGSWAVDARFRV